MVLVILRQTMKSIVGLKELREHMNTYAGRVGRGESFIVVKKSKPLFTISPVDTEEKWETVVDFTKMKKNGVSLQEVLKSI